MAAASLLPQRAAAGAVVNTGGFVLRTSLGYANVVRVGDWAPLTIDVTSLGPAFKGTVLVQTQASTPYRYGAPVAASGGGPSYEFPLILASNDRKVIQASVLVPSSTLTVELVEEGKLVAGAATPGFNVTSLIGVLTDEPAVVSGALQYVSLGQNQPTNVVTLASTDIPDSAPMLRAFDLIVIDDFSTDLLTATQRRALADYVAMGGKLLLGSGISWHRTLSGIDPLLLPMQPTGTTLVQMDSAIPGTAASASGTGGSPAPGSSPAPSARPTVSPVPGTTPAPVPTSPAAPPMQVEIATGGSVSGSVWLTENGNPLMLEKAVGAGGVGMSTFDWAAAPIASWRNAPALLRLAAGRLLLGEPQTPRSVGGQATWQFGAAPRLPNRSQGDLLASAVITLPQRDLPSVPLTALFVLAYALLIFPVNYLVLRAVGRLELAWISLPVMAVLLIGGVYAVGLGSKARAVQRNEITIVYTEPDWSRALHLTYTAVFAPSAGDYRAETSGGVVAPLEQGVGAGDVRVRPQDGAVTTLNAGSFSMHGFITESVQANPGVTAVGSWSSGTLTVQVRNGSGVALSGGYVITGGSAQPVPDLAAGASAVVILPAPGFGSQVAPQVYAGASPYSYGSTQATPEQVEGSERNAVLAMLTSTSGYQFGPIVPQAPGSIPVGPIFLGWSTAAPGPQAVNGSTPVSRSETAYVVPIQFGAVSPGTLVPGMVPARMVQAPVTSGANASGAVYELPVPMTVDPSGRVSINYPFNGGPFTPPQYWDWQNQTWKPATAPYAGAVFVPAEAVDPASRLIRLRVPAFLATYGNTMDNRLTLRGTE